MELTVSIEELMFMTGLAKSTLKNYLENYQFVKFKKDKLINNKWKVHYLFNSEFIKIFEEYLHNKRLYFNLDKFKRTKSIIFDIKGEVNELLGNN